MKYPSKTGFRVTVSYNYNPTKSVFMTQPSHALFAYSSYIMLGPLGFVVVWRGADRVLESGDQGCNFVGVVLREKPVTKCRIAHVLQLKP